MSSRYDDSEIKKPVPRRLFSRAQTDESQPSTWLDSPEAMTSSPVGDAPPATHKELRKALPFLSSSRSASPEPSGSRARARWDSVRRHVLLPSRQSSGSRSGTPTPAPTTSGPAYSQYQHYHQPSSASSTASFPQRPPSRPQTPKPASRLAARLGFRHVVDHAREVVVDENRKLADDVLRACWAARGDPHLRSSSYSTAGGGKGKHSDTLNTVFTGASNIHLPFSNGTAPTPSGSSYTGSSGSATGSGAGIHSKKSEHRGPLSPYGFGGVFSPSSTSSFNVSATLASASASAYNLINSASHTQPSTHHHTPSIKSLHQVLWQASGSSTASLRSVYLPYESLVLSALLVPFLGSGSDIGNTTEAGRVEEERWLAVDAFELMVKTWPPANELASAERCLWCTKAATPLPASPLRSRVLSALWGLTNPNENSHVFLSPDTILSIACGVFLLFPLISLPPPTSPISPPSQNPHATQEPSVNDASPDEKILSEVLSHLSTGVLDEEACEDEYGNAHVKWNAREDDADVIRRMMLSESLTKCLTVVWASGGAEGYGRGNVARLTVVGGWLVGRSIDDYWIKLKEKPTQLQIAISVRRIMNWCNGVVSFLSQLPHLFTPSSPANDQNSALTFIIQRVMWFLENVIIPEIHTLSPSPFPFSATSRAEERMREARMSVTRVILELFCVFPWPGSGGDGATRHFISLGDMNLNPAIWAGDLIVRWFTVDVGLGWKVSFEDMLKDFVTNAEWRIVVERLTNFVTRMCSPGDGVGVRKEAVVRLFSCLTDRLIQDPPPAYLLAPSHNHARNDPNTNIAHPHNQFTHSRSSSSYTYSSSVSTPPHSSVSTTTLPELLKLISEVLPQTFFKPLFSLATSLSSFSTGYSTESVESLGGIGPGTIALANTLCVVHALSAIVRDWWLRDAEMICVALMSDVGGSSGDRKGKGKARDDGEGEVVEVGRGVPSLGQMIVLLELVNKLRAVRRLRDSKAMSGGGGSTEAIAAALGSETARVSLSKFVVGLELRLAILIQAKEKRQPLPSTQRLLILMLFREIRLLTRSLKPAPWISNVAIRWFEEYLQDEDEQAEEVQKTLKEMREVYELSKGAVGNSNKRRTVVIIPTTTDKTSGSEETLNVTVMLYSSLKLLSSLREGGFIARAVKLLVTVSAMLNSNDWGRVAPLVWHRGLLPDRSHENDLHEGRGGGVAGEQKPRAVTPLVCFLVMQCAEKNALDFRAMVEVDMRSSDDLTRLESVYKLSLLVNWRFQIMSESHNILVDRTHRPFRLARAPLPFVPTDMGSPNYVYSAMGDASATVFAMSGATSSRNSSNAPKSRKGSVKKDVIPVELKRQLVEIGWVDDDDEGDEKELWIRTPMSLLPVNHVERLDLQRPSDPQHGRQHGLSPTLASSPVLSSPTSSSGGQLTPLISPSPSGSGGSGGKVDGSASGGGEGELLRRNSSSGGPTYAKRRPVFVPPLSLVFRVLATMVFDRDFSVASAARDTLLDMMRNDPALLLRPILDLFCDDQGHGYDDSTQKDVRQAINIFTALLHTRHMIPPPMAHALFNNLAGFLKYTLRQTDPSAAERGDGAIVPAAAGDSLATFALTIPIMARLAMYVGDFTIREIKKSKMEHFLIPYGTLWFDHVGVPGGPMFPRGLSLEVGYGEGGRTRAINPSEPEVDREGQAAVVIVGLDSRLVKVVMIRIAQNMMFVEMLKKNAQDVVLVRKTMPKFVMPRLDGREREVDGRMLEFSDFVPFTGEKFEERFSSDEHAKTLNVLSLASARSYVTLVAQVFRCMSRNSNDREEMANFMVGLNKILLAHGDDIGIVGHVLIAFMVASARFRRLFTSGGGYALFMPVLVKIYTEMQQRVDIKLAVEYAVYRFYALHREAFLFQSLDAIAHVAALPETDTVQYAARVYELFYSLRSGIAPTNLDPAGIHGMNQLQEKEALLFHAAEDKPQTLLTAIRRRDAQTSGQIFFEVPDTYESSRLRMEDFVKLFLTIIAHDPTVLRAQRFMRMFRFLAPHLYNASPQARSVLQDGLEALSEILIKVFSKSKVAEAGSAVRDNEADITLVGSVAGQEAPEKNKTTSSPCIMRMDFLFALVAVGQAGCHIPPQMAKQSIEIARLVLKGTPSEMLESLSAFFAELTKLVLLRGDLSKPKYVIPFVQEISPFFRAYATILDFTSVFETVTQLCSTPPYTHDPAFARLIIHEICVAGLETCELITDEAESSRTHFRAALIALLAEAVLLRGSDMIGELEKRKPTFHFLAKVVLPLALTLETSSQLASRRRTETWHHQALTSSWIRLLSYAMTACQRSFRAAESLPLSRSKSHEKKSGEEKQWQAHLPTFATALQIIKVIVVRAEMEISSTFPDLWQRLAAFLKSALMDGNADFALHGSAPTRISPVPSPSPSPRGSTQIDRSGRSPSYFDLPGQSTVDASSTVPFSSPRMIDYAVWSVFEFLCAYRSPLRLQLRLFIVEKVVALDQELKHRERRQSPFTSPSMTPRSRRASTSIFAKPRRSGISPSPDSSPRASRSPSMIHELSIPSIHLGPGMNRTASLEIPTSSSGGELRIPGYQYVSPTMSPSTPKQGTASYLRVDEQGPRIVHLGPTSPSALIPPPPLSPSGGGSMGVSNIHLMGQSTRTKSLALAKATYQRIRLVQTFMGYDMLLPLPIRNVGLGISGLGMENDEVSFVTWTRRSALEAILNEMKQLEEEFKETGNRDNEDILTEPGTTSTADPIQLTV